MLCKFSSALFEREEKRFDIVTVHCADGDMTVGIKYTRDYNAGLVMVSGRGAVQGDAMRGSADILKVLLDEGITAVGQCAFCDDVNLSAVQLPSSLSAVGDHAFSNCPSLTDVYYAGTEAQWAQISFGVNTECLTGAVIHYESAFRLIPQSSDPFLYSLADGEAVIPANNAVFSENAFAGCDSVTFRCSRNSSAAQYAAANGAIRCEYTD